MIRPATEADIPGMVILGDHFVNSTTLHEISPYSKGYAANTLKMMIRSKEAFVKVLDIGGELVGFCGGRYAKTVFSGAHKIGQEDFMWVEPPYRGGWGVKMIAAMEEEAKAAGCLYWSMICLEDSRPKALDRLYKNLGYKPLEHRYVKILV